MYVHLFIFTLWALKNLKHTKLQQKGLDDYKLATANASMNADFCLDDRSIDVSHALSSMTLDSADAEQKKPADKPVPKNEKQAPVKEVWLLIISSHLLWF